MTDSMQRAGNAAEQEKADDHHDCHSGLRLHCTAKNACGEQARLAEKDNDGCDSRLHVTGIRMGHAARTSDLGP